MKLILENFKQALKEEEGEEAGIESMEALLGANYEKFVSYLKGSIKDPRVQAVLKGGLKDRDPSDDVVTFTEASPAVKSLVPTQKEVDIDKSLAFPLKKDPSQFIEKVVSDGPFTVVAPIIIYDNKYVMDGHHRWSTVYACNQNASITAINMSIEGLKPLDALKLIQMAIGVEKKQIPVQTVEGNNLFTIGETEFYSWVKKNTSPETYQLILKNQKLLNKIKAAAEGSATPEEPSQEEELAEAFTSSGYKQFIKGDYLPKYLWSNIQSMRQTSQPVPGAPERGYMPQTDDVNWTKPLKQGEIDIKPPYAKVAENKKLTRSLLKKLIKEEISRLKSKEAVIKEIAARVAKKIS